MQQRPFLFNHWNSQCIITPAASEIKVCLMMHSGAWLTQGRFLLWFDIKGASRQIFFWVYDFFFNIAETKEEIWSQTHSHSVSCWRHRLADGGSCILDISTYIQPGFIFDFQCTKTKINLLIWSFAQSSCTGIDLPRCFGADLVPLSSLQGSNLSYNWMPVQVCQRMAV